MTETTETERIEQKHNKSKIRKAARKDESSVSFYLHASLFLFFLMTYAFLLFLHKNKYPLLVNNEILPEVLFNCFALLVFSFACLFLLSFWRFLARVFIAAIAGGMVAYILGLLFPFNIGNYLVQHLAFLPKDTLLYISGNGNLIIAGVSFLFFLILLHMFKGGAMAFLSLPILVAIFMLLNTASKQTIPEKIQTAEVNSPEEKTENLVYLILADHTGYNASAESWQTLIPKDSNPEDTPHSPSFISAFYQTNKFTFYPSAYLRYPKKYRNIGNFLNPSLTEIGDDLFSYSGSFYYIGANDAQVSATRNDLFKALKDKGYHLNIYQSFPFNFCADAGEKEISNCVTYPAPIGALYQTGLSTTSRMMLLAGHWLYSTPFGKKVTEYVYKKTKDLTNTPSLPFIGNPLSKSLPIGQPLVLTHMRHDILNASGKNVFFAHLDLPHYPYVYDQNCQLKTDPLSWRSNAPYTEKTELGGELKRWENYNQQLFCTYAQINYLIKDLEKADLLNKTTIVIHGDKGADIQKEKTEMSKLSLIETRLYAFKNNMTTVFGVYKPKGKAQINVTPCDIATLIDRHVLGNTADICQPPDFAALSYAREEQNQINTWLSSSKIEDFSKPLDFKKLYTNWLENGGQAYMASLDEQLKKEEENFSSSKISFVAPPSFMDTPSASKGKSAKDKTPDFVPVPEEKVTDIVPLPPEEKGADIIPLPPEPLPIPGTETAPVVEGQFAEPFMEPSAVPFMEPSATPEMPAVPVEQQPEPEMPAVDVISDDFGKLPAPIVLPKMDSDAQNKWKTTNIKEGQTTTLELLPPTVNDNSAPQTALPEQQPEETVAPQAAPAAQVEVLELLALETENLPVAEPMQQPETQASVTEQILPVPEPTVSETPAQPSMTEEEQAIAAAEEQIKAAQEAKEKALAAAQARAQAAEDARLKAEAEAKAIEEEEAKIQAEIDEKLKAAQEAKAKAQAAAEARAKAEEEARRLKAEEEARAKAEAEARIKAAKEAQAKARAAERAAKAKAEEEERRRQEEAEREEMRKKTPPPPPANADELDIVKETLVEHVNDEGEVETFIYLERKPNPNKSKKKLQKEKEPERELKQPELIREPAEQKISETPKESVAPPPETVPQEAAAPSVPEQQPSEPPVAPQPAPTERVLED
ncbi:MAG: hypothetical protein J5716_05640 [Alphaproteobacteria bacterium]|nr:hypothetical protein [Alphaproteobacteria bacterium]